MTPPGQTGSPRRLQRLTWSNLMGVTQAALMLCRTAFLLRRMPFARLLDTLRLNDKAPAADPARVERAAQLVRWAHRVAPIEPNCLLDSLAAAALVRRQGFCVPLSIGVKLEEGSLQAHAWLDRPSGSPTSTEAGLGFRVIYRVPHEC